MVAGAMRRAARIDLTQRAIVDGLRVIGASVVITSGLGADFPDLVVGYHGVDALIECKTEDRAKNGVKRAGELLSPGQRLFGQLWRGSPVIVAYGVHDIRDELERRVLRRRLQIP